MNDLIIYFSELTDTRDTRGLKHELTSIRKIQIIVKEHNKN